jgi:hypothetical protein
MMLYIPIGHSRNFSLRLGSGLNEGGVVSLTVTNSCRHILSHCSYTTTMHSFWTNPQFEIITSGLVNFGATGLLMRGVDHNFG